MAIDSVVDNDWGRKTISIKKMTIFKVMNENQERNQ